MKEEFTTLFSSFSGKEEELIPVLQKIQEHFGFLSDESMMAVGQFLGIPESKVFATATFYAQFRFKPRGKKHIMLCRGTACHVKGIPRISDEIEKILGIKEGETSADLEYSIESVACIGACSLAPCIVINNKVETDLTPMKIEDLFKINK